MHVGIALAEAQKRKALALGQGLLESGAEVEAERQRTVALVVGLLESAVGVEAEEQTAVALGDRGRA